MESDWTQKCKQIDRANQRPFSVLRPFAPYWIFSLNSCNNSMISTFGAWHEWTDMLCWYHPRISNFHSFWKRRFVHNLFLFSVNVFFLRKNSTLLKI
jgi:hypothetical protein